MLEALFWDHNGDFQAATAAAAVALIGAIISAVFSWLSYKNSVKTAERQYIMEQKKIDADLKAKARIEWITEVRNLVSKYLSYLFDIKILISRMQDIEEELSGLEKQTIQESTYIDRQRELKIKQLKKEEELMICIQESILTAEKILLHFSKKDEHKAIEKELSDSVNIIKDIEAREARPGFYNIYLPKTDKTYASKMRGLIDNSITRIRNIFREYLKTEWDRAKKGD
ncbi:hypothetical protein [Enterococcus faecalis]|uniref:hypothetical protein n=1 Tax=Enterococcus faecalis TaxID=1351 RepID=UPI001639E958|nr:hypothetical protein [Enterococcus faecalis]MBC2828670.1 hypothetical protein [Enterococcus faecalis]